MYKIIRSGKTLEIYRYEYISRIIRRSKINNDRCKLIIESESNFHTLDKSYNKDHIKPVFKTKTTRTDSYFRAKNTIRRLIDLNFNSNSVFVTLTFKKDIRDIKEANKLFILFAKKLRYTYGKKFKYISVPELQNKTRDGVIHYHMIMSRTMPIKKFQKLWGHGYVKLNRIKHVKYIGAYISKYLTKEQAYIKGKNYWSSRNMIKPVITWDEYKPKEIWGIQPEYIKEYDTQYFGKIRYMLYSIN